jgi:hypothetical protein
MPELRGAVKLWQGWRGVEEVQYNHYGDEMRMTKQGAVPVVKEDVWVGKCDYCKSEYEAKLSELNCESGRNMVADCTATCEVCNRRVYFKKLVKRGMQS